jgi:O-acetyl-ADP-ribose deacetylase (regulator of RNase III)
MERPAMRTNPEKIRHATLAALRCADGVGAQSIAIPGMGTGVGGVSFEDAAEAMVTALREFSSEAKSLKKVLLCDLGEAMVKAWKKALAK